MGGCLRVLFAAALFACVGLSLLTLATQEAAESSLRPISEDCPINNGYPNTVRQWCDYIDRYASENELDPNLISAVILHESSGKPRAYSKDGAVGLMQVMPSDGRAAGFQCPNGPCFADRPKAQALYDPEFNVAFGTRMLADLIASTGSLREALRLYGPKDAGYSYADMVLRTYQQRQ